MSTSRQDPQPRCCPPVHAVAGGQSLGAGEWPPALVQQLLQVVSPLHRGLQHAPTWSGPGCPSRRPPPRDSPHAVSGGCSRPPPSLPRPSSPCRGRMVGFCGVAPAGPRTTHGSEGSSMARGDPHPHEERRGSCPARFQSCRGHWAIWRGAQPAPGHCPENRPPHAPDPQRRPWREPREGRGPLPWTALQVPVAGGPEDGQVTRKDGGRGPRGVATPHCCPRGASTPSAQHLLQPSRGSWGQVPRRAPSGRGCWLENKRGRHRAPRGPRPGPAPTSHALPLAPPASPV